MVTHGRQRVKDKYNEFNESHIFKIKSLGSISKKSKPSILIVDDDAFNLYSLQ